MTVCIATSNYPPHTGGIATCYAHLAAILVKAGHTVIVLVPGYENKTGEDEQVKEFGITIIRLTAGYHRYYNEYAGWFSKGGLDAASWIAAGLAMRDWLVKNHQLYGIDIIETGDYGGLAAFLCSNQLPPVVITGHGSFTQLSRYNPVIEDQQTRLVRQLEQTALQEADGVIAHSPLYQKELEKITTVRVQMLPVPWQQEENHAVQRDGDYAFVAGGLQMVKGVVTMAAATAIIRKTIPGFKLYWAGGDTFTAPKAGRMSEYLARNFPSTWNSGFAWLHELTQKEVLEKMAQAAIVIIPSTWEAFNYVALEAAVAGKPVIMTNSTGASFLFTEGKNALFVPAGEQYKLAEAVCRLWQQEQERKEMGVQAAAAIKHYFENNDPARTRIAYYESIITNRKTASITDIQSLLEPYNQPARKLYYGIKNIFKKITGR